MGARVVVEVSGDVDLRVLDALARLQLAVRRSGAVLVVRGCALLELAGLVEVVGQAEAGEQPRGVEEVVDVGDPPT